MDAEPKRNLGGRRTACAALFAVLAATAGSALATPFQFSTGNTDGRLATASRPASGGSIGIETADDFVLTSQTQITHASFTGLITGNALPADVSQVVISIYRVFPQDSAPASGQVPTRVNSPADVELDSRDSSAGGLNFSTTVLSNSFTADNSVRLGINPAPNQTTGGEGPVTGMEVQFDITFTTPFDLASDHYFFVPQVLLVGGQFMWLSAPRPIVPPGTPFAPDLQSWIRNDSLAPDWLRVGTDIIGGGAAFNAVFSLDGETTVSAVPEPGTLALLGIAGLALLCAGALRVHRA